VDRRGLAQRRRLAAGAVLAVATLVAVATVLAWRQYDDGKQHALNEARARVVLAATVFDTYFGGQLSALSSMAAAPSVVAGNTKAMTAYFKRVQGPKGKVFTGGLGWIDLSGRTRASSDPLPRRPVDVSGRGYFERVVATQKPFISAGLVTRRAHQRALVMAVPTFDAHGRLSGVLAGGFNLQQLTASRQTENLGYEGLVILDRRGQQLTQPDFARPENRALVARMRREPQPHVLEDTRGLSGSSGRVVAFATATAPGWIVAIDRSGSSVFSSALQSLVLEIVSIVVAALIAVGLIFWMLRRANKHAAAEHDRARVSTALSQALADASTPNDAAGALAAALAASFPDALVLVALRYPDRPELGVAGVAGPRAASFDESDESLLEPANAATEHGEALWVAGDSAVRARFPGLQSGPAGRIRSAYAVPILTRADRLLGAVTVLFRTQYALRGTDRAGIAAYVEQAMQAFSRTVRQEREHEAAVTLQRSLLPEELPSCDGVEMAVRYQAGSAGLEVGGDWYDAVRRPDGRLLLSIGDVAGRGLRAATLMAQLRNAFRAYAFEHASPAEVVRAMLRHVPDDEMVTTVCVAIDPYTQEYRYSLAGHPPPLLVDHGAGTVSRLKDAGAPPLGFTSAIEVVEASGTLPHEATLIAYTDGLVERREANIDEGIDGLASALERAPATAESVDELATRLLRHASLNGGAGADDDTAFLIVRTGGAPARVDLEFAADPAQLASLRARLNRWLELRGVGEEDRIDAVIAIHEACINAIEHGYQLRGGTIRVRIDHDRGRLEIVVEDEGEWRPPTPDPGRGRGTLIMQTTMETTRVEHGRNGTRVLLERRLGDRAALGG
jgi:serine phosphatase RsbU (regulator of sigma subunit)/anti-sigma regulatory factor (Ser/Thr protein kinase)